MIDVTIIGGGVVARTCGEVLNRAGIGVQHTFEVGADRSPIILGEVHGALGLARQAMETGRHLLVASPVLLAPEKLSQLFESRKRNQALFAWSDRRHHPAYRFVAGLVEADPTWTPRFLRLETLTQEPTSPGAVRWLTLEALALLMQLTDAEPLALSAHSLNNPKRSAADAITVALRLRGLEACLQLGLGEPLERRETLLAAANRKALVDELNQSTPVRLMESDPALRNTARWLSCAPPTADELARQQCLAFLDATLNHTDTQKEAHLWSCALASLQAMERSMDGGGERVNVEVKQESSRFRLILGQAAPSPSVA